MNSIIRTFIIGVLAITSITANASKVITSHGIAMHGDMKYPADFTHFEYTNPDAPKSGSVTLSGYGTFDSFNDSIVKGDSAAFVSLIYDTLMVQSMDEPFTVYGHVAEKVEYPEDRSWIIFHLNPKARFHDGTTITADDVDGDWVFDQEFFLILNVAVGGEWPGYPDDSTEFPQQMVVDHVRVYDMG